MKAWSYAPSRNKEENTDNENIEYNGKTYTLDSIKSVTEKQGEFKDHIKAVIQVNGYSLHFFPKLQNPHLKVMKKRRRKMLSPHEYENYL